ncbi:MAG: hypothetical protein OXD48_13375, partial [Litoreibacter sp.]|nr:hypothetical protein [Litoreibacter sp.]
SYAVLLEFELPALEPTGTVEAKFSPEQILYDRARVADLADFTRLAIAWEDGAPMAIKASAPDHMPVSIEILGSKGSLHILSYQDDPRQEPGVVRLALEREVDAATCAEGARGSVLKIMPDLPALRYKLKVAAPGCAQIGEMFLLKNALQDLKLAKR